MIMAMMTASKKAIKRSLTADVNSELPIMALITCHLTLTQLTHPVLELKEPATQRSAWSKWVIWKSKPTYQTCNIKVY